MTDPTPRKNPPGLTVGKLLEALEGLDPDAPVIVGIIDGGRYDAAYADQHVSAGLLSAYICCYATQRAWEGPRPEDTDFGRWLMGLGPDAPEGDGPAGDDDDPTPKV